MIHIFSLNLVAFIIYETGIRPEWGQNDRGIFYGIFPDNNAVNYAIQHWKSPEVLLEAHRFLNCYKEVREAIKKIRFPEGEAE